MTRAAFERDHRVLPPVADLADGLRALGELLEAAPPGAAARVRTEVPVRAPTAALALPAGFAAGSLDPLLLAGRDWSGAGCAWECDPGAADLLPTPLEALGHDARLALSVRFDAAREADGAWADFGRCRLWQPALEFDAAARVLALNLDPADPAQRPRLLAALAAWRPRPTDDDEPLAVTWQDDRADRAAWTRQVEDALARLGDDLVKVVLARRRRGELPAAPHPARLLAHRPLGEGGWPWWLARGGRHWLGETPERLGRRDGRRLQTVALAGTRPRGPVADLDQRLGRDLLESDKDRREQEAVAAWVRRRLAYATGAQPHEGPLELVKLPDLQHLGRRFEATAAGPLRERDWVAQLHPTPALCGSPRAAARAWLRATEDFDRGLYGGALGWVQEERAELYVTIRGVVLAGGVVTAYAGCGLVPGSEAAAEWRETEAKILATCRRLGLVAPARGFGA